MQYNQEQGITQVYIYFRFILAAVLCFLILAAFQWDVFTSFKSHNMLLAAGLYLVLALTNLVQASFRAHQLDSSTIYFVIITDILLITLLMHLSGGLSSGLAILMLTPVAAAGIFFYGITATLTAAIATLLILADVLYYAWDDPYYSKYIVPAGFFGIVLFVASICVQILARRIRTTQENLLEHIDEVASLEELNRYIVQRLRTGILVLSPQGKIRLINDAANEMLGITTEQEFITGKLAGILHEWRQTPDAVFNSFRQENGLPEVRVNFSTIGNSQQSRHILAFIENNSELTQQAQQMKLASLGRLSASIAHEIRNPLNAISHASQLLNESEELDPQDRRLLEIIDNHTQRLNGIVSNTLGISRRSPPVPERIDLDTFLQEQRKQMQEAFEQDISFHIDIESPELHISFDHSQLTQILVNIIENALRYSFKETGEHWVTVKAYLDTKHEKPILNILDNGIGISPEEAEKVFEPFYTTDSQGTGLGLYICKELCELNQAELEYVINDNEKGFFQIRFSHPDKRTIQS